MMKKKHHELHYANGVRIISGQWKGRKFPILKLDGLRPTPGHIRETLFNWLSPYIINARVLDCFSGSGVLAMESLSRQASFATLLEYSSLAVRQLNANLTLLGSENSQVIKTDSLIWLKQKATKPFDIIFIDPPFHKNLVSLCCQLIRRNGYMHKETLVYTETEFGCRVIHEEADWCLLKEKYTKSIRYSLWRINT